MQKRKILQIKNLSVCEKKNQIIKNITISLDEGESLSILGHSGSGKTTFLRTVAGFVKNIQSGEIMLHEKIMQNNKKIFIEPNERPCVMIFQHPSLWPHMNTCEHLRFASMFKNKKAKDGYGFSVNEILDITELSEHKEKLPRNLSGGEKQRLSIARALITGSKILILDEAFSSLDLILKHNIIKLIKKLQDEFKISIILATHDPIEAYCISDNVAIFNKGLISWKGSFDTFLKEKNNEQSGILQTFDLWKKLINSQKTN